MSGLEDAVSQLKEEGYTSEDIKKALQTITDEVKSEDTISGNLCDYLDTLRENSINALQVAQRINYLSDQIQGIGFMYDTIQEGNAVNLETVYQLLQKESVYLKELKMLQDELESIEIE